MKKLKIIKIALGLIFISGVIIFGTLITRIWDPLWNPFRPEPEKVMEMTKENFKNLKSFKIDAEFEILKREEKERKIKGKVEAFVVKREKENQQNIKIIFHIGEEKDEFLTKGEIISIGEEIFIKFDEFPPIEQLTKFDLYPYQIEGKWIKIDSLTTKELVKSIEESLEIEDLIWKFEKVEILHKDFQKQIKNLLSEKKFYLVKEELPDEKNKEGIFYHYLLILNEKEVKNLLFEIIKIYSRLAFQLIPEKFGPKPEEREKIIADIFDEINRKYEKEIKEAEIKVWIGKKNLLPNKIEIGKGIENLGSLILTIKFSQFNEKFDFSLPAEFSTIKEVFEEFFSPLINWLKIQKRDEKRRQDIQNIKNALDKYFDLYKVYPASKTFFENLKIKIDQKEECLFENCQRPKDPGSGPCQDYQWISNLKNPQKFCIFACLENGRFFAASNKGIEELKEPPKTLDCW